MTKNVADLILNASLSDLSFYFVGIGGVSMSGLALFLIERGCKVCGSDISKNENTQRLQQKGVTVYFGHDKNNVPQKADVCVVNSAISQLNEEVLECKRRNIKIITRGELLGAILNSFDYSIAVAGCHGKTTTTALAYETLLNCQKNPTLFLGGNYKGQNYVGGKGKVCIAEACEYTSSFLSLSPKISVLLNIDYDHVDCFANIEEVKNAFCDFANKTATEGVVVAESCVATFLKRNGVKRKIISFGVGEGNFDCDYFADNLICNNGCYSFDLYEKKAFLGTIDLTVCGKRLVDNALATVAVARLLGCEFAKIKMGLESFVGVERRWQAFESDFTNVVADYAHHPTEIKNLLAIAKNFDYQNIYVLFQPHTYSRTKRLLNEFASCFCGATRVVVLPVFSARETPTDGGQSEDLVEAISKYVSCKMAYTFEDAKEILSCATKKDILLVVGAGDVIGFCSKEFLTANKEK